MGNLAKGYRCKEKNLKISILGLAYKENTNSIKNSPSLKLISYLSNFSVLVHDPAVKDDLPCFVERKETVNECINGCHLLIIATPWDEYRNLRISEIKKKMKGRIIIDPYRVVDGLWLDRKDFRGILLSKVHQVDNMKLRMFNVQ